MTDRQTAKVHIRKNDTEEVRIAIDEYWSDDYQWQDGNYSCDCNRHLFFERAGGREPAWDEYGGCTDGHYDIVRVELADGTEHPDPSIFNHPRRA